MSKFDEWEAAEAPPEKSSRLEELAKDYLRLKEQAEIIKTKLDVVSAEIASHTPEEPGEFSLRAGKKVIVVKRSEKWTWDSEALEALYGGRALPEYVKRKLSVARKDYDRLDADVQAELNKALTRSPSAPRISVVEVA
jgi:Holliday junction resolvase-like predicted endonuclease